MKSDDKIKAGVDVGEGVRQLREAAAARKCWHCGCLRSSLRAIEEAFPAATRPAELVATIEQGRARLAETKYDCLGCEVCFPAIAINALGVEGDACPAEPAEGLHGWQISSLGASPLNTSAGASDSSH